uniref:Uncharacterized protein n=1 Tax=Mustela putorius furo TaxID=9669 RepID=M3YKQ2_MUSPF
MGTFTTSRGSTVGYLLWGSRMDGWMGKKLWKSSVNPGCSNKPPSLKLYENPPSSPSRTFRKMEHPSLPPPLKCRSQAQKGKGTCLRNQSKYKDERA